MHISGSFGNCTINNPCIEDEGDCDNDDQCKENHRCGTDNCRSLLGKHSQYDCCYSEDEDFCTIDAPCSEDEGDCDSHDMCQDGLLCGLNNCPEDAAFGYDSTTDCCYVEVIGQENFCQSGIPCKEAEGDCDSNDDCDINLFCGSNNCPDSLGFDFKVDCCYELTSNTLMSPNYPNFYPNDHVEPWLITADVGLIINLQFHSFQVYRFNSSQMLTFNFLHFLCNEFPTFFRNAIN